MLFELGEIRQRKEEEEEWRRERANRCPLQA
jgi:hypothetical protein